MSLAHVLAAGLLAASSTGCVFMDLLLGSGPFDPDASFPPFPFETAGPPAFATGRATLTLAGDGVDLAGQTIVLDELVTATSDATLGSHVVWENEDGWYVGFSGISGFGPGVEAYLTIDRITDHEHWVFVDPTRCLTTTTQLDAAGLVGTATCRGVRWADYFDQYNVVTGFPRTDREPAAV